MSDGSDKSDEWDGSDRSDGSDKSDEWDGWDRSDGSDKSDGSYVLPKLTVSLSISVSVRGALRRLLFHERLPGRGPR